MMELDERTALAHALGGLPDVARQVTSDFFALHADWELRFGPRGRVRCMEDTQFHLSFLAAAVQAGRPASFVDYIRWTAAILDARSIDASHLVEHLELLELHLGNSLSVAHTAYAATIIAAATAALSAPSEGLESSSPTPAAPLLYQYVEAALAGRRAEALDIALAALEAGWPLPRVYRELLIASQRRLGELWAGSTISVAQEHMATAVTGWVVARLYQQIQRPAASKGRALVAGIEGELHMLPAHFAADLLELDGWDVSLVGIHVPETSLVAMVVDQRPDLVGLSVTMPFNLPPTVALVRSLRARVPGLRITLGGRAVADEQALAAELGVELGIPKD